MENKIKIAYIFSFIYGYINSLGFIIMNGLFFTFMSGNSVRLGVNIGELNLGTGFRYFSLFLFLIFGAFIGDIIFSYYRKTGMFILLVLELFLFMTAAIQTSLLHLCKFGYNILLKKIILFEDPGAFFAHDIEDHR